MIIREQVETVLTHAQKETGHNVRWVAKALMDKFEIRPVGKGGTHSAECWQWHHECAIAKIEPGLVLEPLDFPRVSVAVREAARTAAEADRKAGVPEALVLEHMWSAIAGAIAHRFGVPSAREAQR